WEAVGGGIDRLLAGVMHLPNLFIAVVDAHESRIRFVYTRDRHDRHADRPMDGPGLTDRVYASGRPLLLRRPEADGMLATGRRVKQGGPGQVWLGVPWRSGGQGVAVMATQAYTSPDRLGPAEQAVMEAVAPVAAGLVHRVLLLEQRTAAGATDTRLRLEKEALFARLGHETSEARRV